jgi:hypothetical protein
VGLIVRQGDQERELGLKVTPMNDRLTSRTEKSQMAFIQHVCKPMFESIATVIPELSVAVTNAHQNTVQWQMLLANQTAGNEDEASSAHT